MKIGVMLVLTLMLTGCGFSDEKTFQGYVENNLSYMTSPEGGVLETLPYARGAVVSQHNILFVLAKEPESEDVQIAAATLESALATADDLSQGQRPEKLAQIKAQIAQTQAELEYSEKEWLRRKTLIASDAIQINMFDQASRDVNKTTALLEQYQASLKEAELPARRDQIKAAQANVRAADAALKKAQWLLSQKTVKAPENGFVFDTYYQIGEYVPAGMPVVSLMIPYNTKAIFFVPERELSRITLGHIARVHCDNCKDTLTGQVSFISPTAEYTPPLIYSRDNRDKLVYRIEVSFEEAIAKTLHPGQPIDVTL